MIFAWFWDRNLLGNKPYTASSYDIQIQRVEGGDISLERTLPVKLPSTYTLDKMVLSALDSVLTYVANQNLGPTKTSRFIYLWFFTVTSGFHWVNSSASITGTKDSWNWDTQYPLSNTTDTFVWMNRLLMDTMPTFVPTFDVDSFYKTALMALDWDSSNEESERQRIQTAGHYAEWKSAWDTWYAGRQDDGNVAASAVPSNSVLPNGSQTLEVTTTTDNPNNFTDPQKWVPLTINEAKKNYLTYGWGDVTSTGLTSAQETTILGEAQDLWPGTADTYNDGSERANEIDELVTITGSLTDTQKMIAEFWAGGPFTVSPPGMFIYFWRFFIDSCYAVSAEGLNKFFFSGFDLAIHLFETGRLVWHSKKDNIQARPIQEIRRMYRGQTLTKWDGTSISGEAWTPYQETNFVTPPFPDFPSGHSAFSQSFANVMDSWFGSDIKKDTTTLKNMNLISPIFSENQTMPFGNFTIPTKSSQIQTNIVPNLPLTFTYSTWQAMADEAGISRKYGGIHATSAHTGSQALANALHPVLDTAWSIAKS